MFIFTSTFVTETPEAFFVERRRRMSTSHALLQRIKDGAADSALQHTARCCISWTDGMKYADRILSSHNWRVVYGRRRTTGAKRMQIITRYAATEPNLRHRSLCGHGTPKRRRYTVSQLHDTASSHLIPTLPSSSLVHNLGGALFSYASK